MKIAHYTIGLCFFLASLSSFSQVQTVGTFINEENAMDGYTLVFPFNSKDIFLINNCGQKVHEWKTATPTLVAYLQPNGDIIKAGMDLTPAFGNPGVHGIVERYNWNGTKVWSHKISNDSMVLHHDIEVLPNGNILVNAWKKMDPIQKHLLGRDTSLMSNKDELWDEVIMELAPRGTKDADVVWQWRASEHLIQDFDSNLDNYGTISEHPELLNINFAATGSGVSMDWLHFNSITYNENLDQILLSCLTFNEIFIIDHSANNSEVSGHFGGISGKGGDILYRYGNPAAYNKGTLSDKKSFGQHDPNWIKYGDYAGNIIFFNNGSTRGYSSIDIIELPWDGNNYATESNGVFGPTSPVYSYTKDIKSSFFSPVMSNTEILPNGNIFACEATKGKLTEYDITNGEIVWEYVNPVSDVKVAKQGEEYSGRTFRTFKYDSDYAAFTNRSLTPGLPLEQDPWPSDCNGIDTTTKQDTTKQDTTKQDTTHTGGGAWVNNATNQVISVYPNPSNGSINITASATVEDIKVYDIAGKLVARQERLYANETARFDLINCANGLYFVSFVNDGFTHTHRLILNNDNR
ncbi:MAG: hypothetical protein RLZZ337_370 [Bacteroidota bacterium]|jgi:hypothetical protein